MPDELAFVAAGHDTEIQQAVVGLCIPDHRQAKALSCMAYVNELGCLLRDLGGGSIVTRAFPRAAKGDGEKRDTDCQS